MCQHLMAQGNQRTRDLIRRRRRAQARTIVKSVGITGQITGSRADSSPDDIEVPNNSDTQLMRDKLSEGVKEFDAGSSR